MQCHSITCSVPYAPSCLILRMTVRCLPENWPFVTETLFISGSEFRCSDRMVSDFADDDDALPIYGTSTRDQATRRIDIKHGGKVGIRVETRRYLSIVPFLRGADNRYSILSRDFLSNLLITL